MRNGGGYQDSDEIDLAELFRQLWNGRLIIVIVTAISTLTAGVYAFVVSPVYGAQVIIAPGTLAGFGGLAGWLQARSGEPVAAAIGEGKQLAVDSFDLLVTHIESRAIKDEFNLTNQAAQSVSVTAKRGRTESNPVTVIAYASDASQSALFLNAYLTFAAASAAAELNGFFSGMALDEKVTPEMLYRLESPVHELRSPVSPKRPLVIALGLIVGAMMGVLIVMMRAFLQQGKGAAVLS